jgi:predicted alpha/beta hydrolase family esterase
MRNAILLHGLPSKDEYYSDKYPSASNSHWLPWLQKQLLINDIKVDTPEVPRAYDPEWNVWVNEVERFDIAPETILVGHSMGAGFWMRYLSEHPELFVDKVVLVAPWLNLDNEEDMDFFNFDIDPAIAERINDLTIITSDNDSVGVLNTVKFLQEKLPTATFRIFPGYGHFTLKRMKTDAFPELLDALL